jgi:hypothetical protein
LVGGGIIQISYVILHVAQAFHRRLNSPAIAALSPEIAISSQRHDRDRTIAFSSRCREGVPADITKFRFRPAAHR